MVGLNVVLAVINVWYLRTMLATRHDEQTYQVVEVGVDDQFLAHTLRVHAADIARFNPDFRWDPARLRPIGLPGGPRRRGGRRGAVARRGATGSPRSTWTTSPGGSVTSPRASSSTGAAASSPTGASAGWSARPAWSPPTTTGSASAPRATRTSSTCRAPRVADRRAT